MRRYGQHFLINEHAIERIVDSLELKPTDTVFEIGPGRGALTTYLVRRAGAVIAVEVDLQMIGILKNKLGAAKNFRLVESDILEFDFASLPSSGVKIIGNLPYNLTSPILRMICEATNWTTAVIMVQKEVGDRLSASAGTGEYGALTVGVSLFAEIQKIFDLSETSFKPPPRVKSTVVKLTRRPKPLAEDPSLVQKVVQAAFQQRRKTILNALSHGLGLTKEEILVFFRELKIDPGSRAETLSVETYVLLAHLIGLKAKTS